MTGSGIVSGAGSFGLVVVVRARPGADLLEAVEAGFAAHGITQGVVVSGVASLHHATFRNIRHLPTGRAIAEGDRVVSRVTGPLELVSLQGNLVTDAAGTRHLHVHAVVSQGDPATQVRGGHLVAGSPVATTAELVLAAIEGVRLDREVDPSTFASEVVVHPE